MNRLSLFFCQNSLTRLYGGKTVEKKVTLGKILGYIGAGIGVAIALTTDAPLLGAILAMILFGVGNYLGDTIEKIVKGERKVKSGIKPVIIVLIIAVVSVCGFKACTYEESPNLVRCHNCGTMMDPKYIDARGCSRCDGNDWSK